METTRRWWSSGFGQGTKENVVVVAKKTSYQAHPVVGDGDEGGFFQLRRSSPPLRGEPVPGGVHRRRVLLPRVDSAGSRRLHLGAPRGVRNHQRHPRGLLRVLRHRGHLRNHHVINIFQPTTCGTFVKIFLQRGDFAAN